MMLGTQAGLGTPAMTPAAGDAGRRTARLRLEDLFLPLSLAGLVAGACAHLAGAAAAGHAIWAVTTVDRAHPGDVVGHRGAPRPIASGSTSSRCSPSQGRWSSVRRSPAP